MDLTVWSVLGAAEESFAICLISHAAIVWQKTEKLLKLGFNFKHRK